MHCIISMPNAIYATEEPGDYSAQTALVHEALHTALWAHVVLCRQDVKLTKLALGPSLAVVCCALLPT